MKKKWNFNKKYNFGTKTLQNLINLNSLLKIVFDRDLELKRLRKTVVNHFS